MDDSFYHLKYRNPDFEILIYYLFEWGVKVDDYFHGRVIVQGFDLIIIMFLVDLIVRTLSHPRRRDGQEGLDHGR